MVWSCSSLISPIDINFLSASVSQASSESAACSNWKQTEKHFPLLKMSQLLIGITNNKKQIEKPNEQRLGINCCGLPAVI